MEVTVANARCALHVFLIAPQPEMRVKRLLQSIPVLHVHTLAHPFELAEHLPIEGDAALMLVVTERASAEPAVRRLRTAHPEVPLIILAARAQEDVALEALAWGAHDYLIAEQLTDELIARTLRCASQLCKLQSQVAALHAQLGGSHERLRDLMRDRRPSGLAGPRHPGHRRAAARP